MALSIASIKSLLEKEYTNATDDVKNFVAWVEGKDNQVASAHTDMLAAIAKQNELAPVLLKAGYTVNVGSMTAPT